jgi:hypothetical protein
MSAWTKSAQINPRLCMRKDFSRAKAQSAAAFLKGFLCAFALIPDVFEV